MCTCTHTNLCQISQLHTMVCVHTQMHNTVSDKYVLAIARKQTKKNKSTHTPFTHDSVYTTSFNPTGSQPHTHTHTHTHSYSEEKNITGTIRSTSTLGMFQLKKTRDFISFKNKIKPLKSIRKRKEQQKKKKKHFVQRSRI